MLSRRSFLLGSLAGASLWTGVVDSVGAFARRGRPAKGEVKGPQSLARQEWPPAIVPDFAGMIGGYVCFADEFGRLALVDMRRPGNPKNPVRVVGELGGIGRKVVGFTVYGNRAYAIASRQRDPADPQFALFSISLSPATAPSIVSTLPLDKYTDLTAVAASNECICVAGTSLSGENLISVYQPQTKGRQADPTLLSSFSVMMPVASMDIQDRNLCALEVNSNLNQSQLDLVSLASPRSPQTRATIKLDGDYRQMARYRGNVIVAGRPKGGHSTGLSEAKSIVLEPSPHAVSHITLEPITQVLAASAQKDRFVILGESKNGRVMVPVVMDRAASMTRETPVVLPKPKGSYGTKASILLKDKNVYIASGWAGVQILNSTRDGWTPTYTYSIPRLPASGLALWGNQVVLGSSDLKLYDISNPHKPSLVSTQELASAVKSITGAGSYVLCLGKDELTLRKMDELSQIGASLKLQGSKLTFDPVNQKAFVLNEQDKKTVLHRIKVYSNSLSIERSIDLPKGVTRAFAQGGYLLASSLNDVFLYGMTENAELIGTRHFENLAVRDLSLSDEHVLATFVDQQSKGFFLVLSKDRKDIHVIGSVDLPHDGVALATQGTTALTVGRDREGKDLVAIVDFKMPSAPRVVSTIAVVESASAVTIKDRLGIVVGRGIEILSMS